MSIEPEPSIPRLAVAQEFEVHVEPDRYTSIRIFLMQEGTRVTFASSVVPKVLRELIGAQKSSPSVERDLTDFLNQHGDRFDVHFHTEHGVVKTRWENSISLGAKTELDLTGGRIRVRKAVLDKDHPDVVVPEFARVGERLVVDLENNRLISLADTSGWYIADLLHESVSSMTASAPADPLTYEPEEDPDPEAAFLAQTYTSVLKMSSARSSQDEKFQVSSEPFEIALAHFNDRKVSYPKEQRTGYLKDLILKVAGQPAEARESQLSFRVTLARKGGSSNMSVKGSCLWDGQWFDFGGNFFKYFEHLHSMRSSRLKRKPLKRRLAEAAFRLLFETDETRAEKTIELEMAKLSLEDPQARWEAEEYLRRFFKTFVMHEVENMLATREAWCWASVDHKKLGLVFSVVQETFGGDLLEWLERQEKEVAPLELFLHLRSLHARLGTHGIQLCFNQRSVQNARFRVKVGAVQKSGLDWFEVHPEVTWNGTPVSESEWRAILENQGILENGENLWVLDPQSLKTLEMMKELLRRPSRKNGPVGDPASAAAGRRVPRLHVLDWVHLRQWGAEVELAPENERWIRRLLSFETMGAKELPQRFRGQLRDYQKEGYEWLAFLYEHGLGGCLADDMGLGKTVQAIAFLGGIHEGKFSLLSKKPPQGPHLVVVPTTLVFNWKQEFQNFYPDLSVVEYTGSSRAGGLSGADVLLTTYDLMRREEKFFRGQRFHVVIFDEAQFMKNITAKRTASARGLKSDFVLTLTGTPLENHLGEYYSILDISLPGLLGPYEEFKRLGFSDPTDRLKKRAAPFVLRRTKDKTLKELPPKTENEVYLRMSPRQKALYQKVVSSVRRTVDKAFEQNSAPQASLTALTAILRLRQVCVSPRLLDRKIHERSPKIEFLLSKLREIVEEDHSALIFSQFTSFLDVLEEEIKKEKLEYFRMDGRTPKTARKSLVDAFQCGAGAPLFLISLKTGGVGLNLTRASYVFHIDPWWNPAVENQASDRVHRIGQKKNVFVTRLLMERTVEEKMVLLKKKKAQLYREVLDGALPKSGKAGFLTKDDFEFLLA